MEINISAKNYGGVYSQLIYRVTGADSSKVVEVSVMDTHGNTLGMKQMRGKTEYAVNIAPYLRGKMSVEPVYQSVSGFYRVEGRCVAANIKVMYAGEAASAIYSDLRSYTAGIYDQVPPVIMSHAGGRLEIGRGEFDEIPIASSQEYLKGRVTTFSAEGESVSFNFGGTAGFRNDNGYTVFILNVEDIYRRFFEEFDCVRMKVEINTVSGQPLASREYVISDRPKQARMAWLNPVGGIDYYSFAALDGKTLQSDKKTIYTPQGYRVVASQTDTVYTARSAFEPEYVIGWLAEIAAAPKVWMVEGEKFLPVSVEAQNTILSGPDPVSVALTFRTSEKQSLQHN